MKSIAAALLSFILLCATGGCTGPDRPAWLSLNPNDWSNRGSVDEPLLFEVSGPIAVDIRNFAGDVTVQGNPKLDRAKVTIVREALHGHKRTDEAKESLSSINYTAELVAADLGQALSIETRTSHEESHYQCAHIYVEVPEIEGVHINTNNGRVWARDVRGRINISTNEGDVRVMTNQAMVEPVTIVNRNGDIDYRVRGESTGIFDAQTIDGQVNHVVRYGMLTVKPTTRRDTLDAVLNQGQNRIVLRTVNGDIRIAVVHNPEHVGQHIIN